MLLIWIMVVVVVVGLFWMRAEGYVRRAHIIILDKQAIGCGTLKGHIGHAIVAIGR